MRYYSDSIWNVKTNKPYTISTSGLWKEFDFSENVGDLCDIFECYDGKFLYVFVPKYASIGNIEEIVSTNTRISIFISKDNEKNFNLHSEHEIQFLNIPEKTTITLGDTYVKEMYCHGDVERII